MGTTAKTSDKLTNFGLNIEKQIKILGKKPYGKVGFPTKAFSTPHNSGEEKASLTVGEVAVVNEFGTATIPARSFVGSSYDKNVKKWREHQKRLRKKVMSGEMDVEKALKLMCLEIQTDQKKMIRAGGYPYIPNAPSTIKAKTRAGKKGDHPLINTAQMLNAVTFVVVMDGKRESD